MTHPAIHKANLMPQFIYPLFQKVIRKGRHDKLNGVRISGRSGARAKGGGVLLVNARRQELQVNQLKEPSQFLKFFLIGQRHVVCLT